MMYDKVEGHLHKAAMYIVRTGPRLEYEEPGPQWPTYDQARRMVDPVWWYVRTGRSSLDWERALLRCPAYMIGRMCAKGGSYDDIVNRVTEYLRKKGGEF